MNSFWDERYSKDEYIYGEKPNLFFAEQVGKLPPGTIILPCEGEGRNAVFAAGMGWQVKAFDSSEAGKQKALRLAKKNNVTIEYSNEDALVARYPDGSADAVALIFAHFVPEERMLLHQNILKWLKPGGKLILEVFNPLQLQNNSGGPKNISMLYTEEMLNTDFSSLEIELLLTTQTVLQEGSYHRGNADVVRLVGTKK